MPSGFILGILSGDQEDAGSETEVDMKCLGEPEAILAPSLQHSASPLGRLLGPSREEGSGRVMVISWENLVTLPNQVYGILTWGRS